jgi:hypothetical protein
MANRNASFRGVRDMDMILTCRQRSAVLRALKVLEGFQELFASARCKAGASFLLCCWAGSGNLFLRTRRTALPCRFFNGFRHGEGGFLQANKQFKILGILTYSLAIDKASKNDLKAIFGRIFSKKQE